MSTPFKSEWLQPRAVVPVDVQTLAAFAEELRRVIQENEELRTALGRLAALERFAAMVTAAAVRETSAEYRLGWNDGQINEREACAHLCDLEAREATEGEWTGCAIYLANNIRARGQA